MFHRLRVAGSYSGVTTLPGIVIHNSIVRIERDWIEMDDCGVEAADGIVESSLRRLQPIALTTPKTVGGLLPMGSGTAISGMRGRVFPGQIQRDRGFFCPERSFRHIGLSPILGRWIVAV